jgi:hypothetical protein
MTNSKMLIAAIVAVGMLFGLQNARAHCDSVDGPVAKAVLKALDNGNLNPVLAYAPTAAEAEIRTVFEKSRKVRGLGADARALADRAFMETVIRLHRAGEGAAYTGLKPAGIDYGPGGARDRVRRRDEAQGCARRGDCACVERTARARARTQERPAGAQDHH